MLSRKTRESHTATLPRLECENVIRNLAADKNSFHLYCAQLYRRPILAGEPGEVTLSCDESGRAGSILRKKGPKLADGGILPLVTNLRAASNSGTYRVALRFYLRSP